MSRRDKTERDGTRVLSASILVDEPFPRRAGFSWHAHSKRCTKQFSAEIHQGIICAKVNRKTILTESSGSGSVFMR